MAAENSKLIQARVDKNDEFYTKLSDIKKELKHYKDHFRDKVVYCNCDNPDASNFYKYFYMNFKSLGLKRLLTSFYSPYEPSYALSLTLDALGEVKATRAKLRSNGDFRSDESIHLLKLADVVVSNPPFSLFRDYVAQLMSYKKSFIIMGNMNAITYKEFFPLLKDGLVWPGYGFNLALEFMVPDHYPLHGKSTRVTLCGKKFVKVAGIGWFTNLHHARRFKELPLSALYVPELYPKFDNYDAINVDKTSEIPRDYLGIMGVPISFFSKFSPKQFEILGLTQGSCHELVPDTKEYSCYREMTSRGRPTGLSGSSANGNPNLEGRVPHSHYFVNDDGHMVHSLYQRVFIKRIPPVL